MTPVAHVQKYESSGGPSHSLAQAGFLVLTISDGRLAMLQGTADAPVGTNYICLGMLGKASEVGGQAPNRSFKSFAVQVYFVTRFVHRFFWKHVVPDLYSSYWYLVVKPRMFSRALPAVIKNLLGLKIKDPRIDLPDLPGKTAFPRPDHINVCLTSRNGTARNLRC